MQLTANDTYSDYLRSLRAVARGLWLGVMDYSQAFDALDVAIRVGITKAWYGGLDEAGIAPVEMNEQERLALKDMIMDEQLQVDGFLSFCIENSKAAGAAWATCDYKAHQWAMRAKDARNKALTMAKSDPKLMWQLGGTKTHCPTCSKLNGKVKRASYWRAKGIQPQNYPNPLLECGGWRCDCELTPTDEPLSKGPLPSVP